MNINEAIELYRKLKDKKAQLKAEYEQKAAPVQEKMDRIEGALLGLMNKSGVDSFKTQFGTAYKTERTRVSCSDKGAFMDFVKDNNFYELLEVRPSKAAVEEFKAGRGVLPPGLDYTSEYTVNIRKA